MDVNLVFYKGHKARPACLLLLFVKILFDKRKAELLILDKSSALIDLFYIITDTLLNLKLKIVKRT